MMSLIPVLAKFAGFGLDLFVRNRTRNAALKENFNAFLARFNVDSKRSAELHEEYNQLKDKNKTE